jgi:enduracididine beta-hydroxylase
MFKFTLSDREVDQVEALVQQVLSKWGSPSDSQFFDDIALYAQELPRPLREFMAEMKYCEAASACIVSGFPVDDRAIGGTPAHWAQTANCSTTMREETAFALFGALLGDLFGWATQQNGSIIHNILPIRGHEHEQLGSGSADLLAWHTEEAFHPLRCDYLGLMCMRNHDRVPTTFASIDMIYLNDEVRQILFEPRSIILPDNSHFANQSAKNEDELKQNQLLSTAYHGIDEMYDNPQKVPVLYGDRKAPYMAVDPYYMRVPQDDQEAQDALNVLMHAIDEQLQDIVLQPGECCFIDNYRAVHGRKGFAARYDGTDRWLKRINITRDLRKSRASRLASTSRVIY